MPDTLEGKERLAVLETLVEAQKEDVSELRISIKELTVAVTALTQRLDKGQNLLLGAVIVFTTIGGAAVWVIDIAAQMFGNGHSHG